MSEGLWHAKPIQASAQMKTDTQPLLGTPLDVSKDRFGKRTVQHLQVFDSSTGVGATELVDPEVRHGNLVIAANPQHHLRDLLELIWAIARQRMAQLEFTDAVIAGDPWQ